MCVEVLSLPLRVLSRVSLDKKGEAMTETFATLKAWPNAVQPDSNKLVSTWSDD